eukprot:Skav222713  [mRNA]  locus=scaffold1661:310560:313324:- [translate_table: standard]
MCSPNCQEVYGMQPVPGQRVSTFSGAYPIALVTRMASGSAAAKQGEVGRIPWAAVEQTWQMLNLDLAEHPGCTDNRADEPSRDKAVRGPSYDEPPWLQDMRKGDMKKFDLICVANSVPKLAARWLRMLLLLGGDIEPHPGPERRTPLKPRGPMNLGMGFAPQTAQRMEACFDAFAAWGHKEFPTSFDAMLLHAEMTATALRAYGLYCFQAGLPRYLFVYAITAVQDRFPQYRPHMTPAWQIDKKWQLYEPGECRAVLPASAIRAAVCIAALWKWFQWLGLVMLGFGAMLHPTEMLSLTRKDLVLPRDTAYDGESMFIHVRDPKTARFARRQHGRIDDALIIAVVDKLFGNLPLSAKLYTASMSVFRKQWNSVMTKLGIPCKQVARGATPAVLRGSGATFLYQKTEDIQWVAWRGRWTKQKTLEYYLQEVSAQLLVHELAPRARDALFCFDRCSWSVLCSALSLQSSTAEMEVNKASRRKGDAQLSLHELRMMPPPLKPFDALFARVSDGKGYLDRDEVPLRAARRRMALWCQGKHGEAPGEWQRNWLINGG